MQPVLRLTQRGKEDAGTVRQVFEYTPLHATEVASEAINKALGR